MHGIWESHEAPRVSRWEQKRGMLNISSGDLFWPDSLALVVDDFFFLFFLFLSLPPAINKAQLGYAGCLQNSGWLRLHSFLLQCHGASSHLFITFPSYAMNFWMQGTLLALFVACALLSHVKAVIFSVYLTSISDHAERCVVRHISCSYTQVFV